jgi:hypothetical protein
MKFIRPDHGALPSPAFWKPEAQARERGSYSCSIGVEIFKVQYLLLVNRPDPPGKNAIWPTLSLCGDDPSLALRALILGGSPGELSSGSILDGDRAGSPLFS